MKKLYIETYGCQMNVADSEVVASVMKMAGYEPTDNEAEAGASCSSIPVPFARMQRTRFTSGSTSCTQSKRKGKS